jgi:hypothetical protein
MKKVFVKKARLKDSQLIVKIDINKAISIARKFLQQYHSPVIFKSAYDDEQSWRISMEVGLSKNDIIEVAVDAGTGKILGYNH